MSLELQSADRPPVVPPSEDLAEIPALVDEQLHYTDEELIRAGICLDGMPLSAKTRQYLVDGEHSLQDKTTAELVAESGLEPIGYDAIARATNILRYAGVQYGA